MDRILEPEWLDELPADAPDAVASRRDLRLVNWFMGNHRWAVRQLLARLHPHDAVAEIGAGDGGLACMAEARIPGLKSYAAFDLAPPPVSWPPRFDWVQGDIFSDTSERLGAASVAVSMLTLHHFTTPQLANLGTRLRNARMLLISEPARRQVHIWQGRCLYPFGINRVTRHDLPISVRAGFLGDELPVALGLDPARWRWKTETTWLGAYRLVAERTDPP